MTLKLLLNTQRIWMIFIKILNYPEKREILFVFYMLNNKELNTIVTEVITRGRKLNLSLAYYIILFCSTKKY